MLKFIKDFIKKILQLLILVVFNKAARYLISGAKVAGNLFYSYYIGAELKRIESGYMFEYPFILKGGQYIKVGGKFSTRARFRIEAWDIFLGVKYTPEIVIGDNVICNFDCHIGAINKVSIGNNVLIGSRVLITDHNHGQIIGTELNLPPHLRPLYSNGPVIIEDNVWIGEGVAILPNVKIGKNSIIGANSVVTQSFPPNSVIAGIPAKLIKTL